MWIARCLDSLLQQTYTPDEILLVAHSCTDRTVEIASKYHTVRIVECTGEGGPIFARMKGIQEAVGDIVVCTDGDAWADKNWVNHIIKPLTANEQVKIVAGYTTVLNNLGWKLASWWQFCIKRKFLNLQKHRFAWGSNMAFRKNDYERVGGFEKFLSVYKSIGVKLYAEDLYISLALQQMGTIHVALDARVYTYLPKEKVSITAQRSIVPIQLADNTLIRQFLELE